jgi:phospholipid/cholesterol/gamma-HCH transport system substrate-binding protein
METKANYIVTGAFTLAVIASVFGFVYWFHNSGGGARATYRVEFTGSVSGLRDGATVLFNGLQAGEVTALALDPADPRRVTAMISLAGNIPIRTDTKVALQSQGLTGLSEIALTGGAPDAPLLTATNGDIPTLQAPRDAASDITQEARNVLSHIDGLVAENEETLHTTLHNIQTVTATLAENSQRLDKVMAGLETLTGGAEGDGEIAKTLESIRHLAENLNKRIDEVSVGLVRFSNSGLKEYEGLAVDGRHTLADLQKAIKNFDQHPSRIIFGGQ